MSAQELLVYLRSKLSVGIADATSSCILRYNREAACLRPDASPVNCLALCGGSGSDFIAEAESLSADAYLTGEMHYHSWFGHPNILLIEAGHFETEQIAPALLADIITQACPDVECLTANCHHSPTLFV
jgi:putative NIF3 family GTP cyclohydrolase 1 type 2